jgi:hypothetical protein
MLDLAYNQLQSFDFSVLDQVSYIMITFWVGLHLGMGTNWDYHYY